MSDTPVKEEMDMEQLLKESLPPNKAGEIVTARVVEVTPEGLMVDVGLKVEGFVPKSEFSSHAPMPAKGETFPALIKRMGGAEGHPLVSWREAKDRLHRDHVLKAKNEQTPLEGVVLRQVKGGLIVDVGMEGFLPASQVDRRPVKDLKPFIGQKVNVFVMEMDSKKGGAVLSRRQFLDKEAAARQAETLKTLTEGMVVTGTVTSLTAFGAFVDIGGIEGLLRVSDVAWGRMGKLSSVLKVGQKIEVKVLKYDTATRKISLGRKQLLPHPWEGVEGRFTVGKTVKGKVTSLTPFGAFVELEPGVEGLIHQSEFSWKERWVKPDQFVKVGQEVEVQVVSCARGEEKIGLSLKRASENPWEEAAKLYRPGARVKGTVTHIVPFGAFVRLSIGVEGLLRVSDISWTKTVTHPKEWVTEGQEIEAVVLEVSPAEEKIALGLKQLVEDPFSKYKPGRVVEGKVARFIEHGAIVTLEPDVEAFVHVSEIPSTHRLTHPSEALALEQVVTGQVLKTQKKSRRIEISIRKYEHDQERKLIKKYAGGKDRITLGEMTAWEGNKEEDVPSA
ncbi:MAG TPA: S1 RNA-binding domain-containing protein [Elusimicrobiota bacterium]|nr:S1 RNA-binding domain-containing protein [Elusimicrobiota bacterium]